MSDESHGTPYVPRHAYGEPSLADLIGDIRIRFWQCPITEHAQRRGVVTVEWEGDVAHCTVPDCDHTSAHVTPDDAA